MRRGTTPGSFNYGPWVKITNANDLGVVSNTINAHISNKSNPHGVTKAQVDLGKVDNTADSAKSVKYAASAGTVNGHTINSDVPANVKWDEINGGSKTAKYTLTASNWSGTSAPYTYDLGPTYGANSIIGFDAETGTEEQLEASSSANIQGSSTTKIYAYGDKPTVDIPIVIIYQ